MTNENIPDNKAIWDAVTQTRLDLAEIKGMMSMHFRDGEHHHPPCAPATAIQKTLLSATGAAVLALLAAIGSLIMILVGN